MLPRRRVVLAVAAIGGVAFLALLSAEASGEPAAAEGRYLLDGRWAESERLTTAGHTEEVIGFSEAALHNEGAHSEEAHAEEAHAEEAHSEEAHGHSHGHHHAVGVNEVGKVTLTTAALLVGFLVVNMVILRLVNYPDGNIRSYIWKMISSTISIFLAVLFNNAMDSFIFKQVIPSPFPRGFGLDITEDQRLAVKAVYFVINMVAISGFCYLTKELPTWLYGARVISGHVCGFAGISFFGEWQIKEKHTTIGPGIILGAFIFDVVARYVSNKLRERVSVDEPLREYSNLTLEKTLVKTKGGRVKYAGTHGEDWKESAAEAEDDGAAMYISFLISQFFVYLAIGDMASLHFSEDQRAGTDIKRVGYATTFLLVCLLVTTYARSKIDKSLTGFLSRLMNSIQLGFMMTFGWLLLRVFDWFVKMLVPYRDLSQCVTAFIVSALGVVVILILDKFADNVKEEHERRDKARQDPHTPDSPSMSTAWSERIDKLSRLEFGEDPTEVLGDLTELLELNELEKALRTIILGFSLLIGICWERAFAAANEAIVHGNQSLYEHQVVSVIVLAVLNVLFVFPAWLYYIVPKAQKDWTDFEEIIKLEKRQYEMTNHRLGEVDAFVDEVKDWPDKKLARIIDEVVQQRFEGDFSKIRVLLEGNGTSAPRPSVGGVIASMGPAG